MATLFKPKLIVLDLNKTLIRDNSWLNLNRAMGVTESEDDLLTKWGRDGIINDQQGQDILCAIYKKRGNPSRQTVFDIVCSYEYFDGAKEAVRLLQDKGFSLALLSGSMDVVAERASEDLGISRWATNNKFVFDGDEMLERIHTTMNEAEFKAVQLTQWCSELGIRGRDVAIVGDGASDLQLATVAGFVVAVGKDSELASRADVVLAENEYSKLSDCFSE